MPDPSPSRKAPDLETRVTLLEDGQERMEGKLDAILRDVSQLSRGKNTNWGLVAQGGFFIIAVGTIIWATFARDIAAATTPLTQRVTVLEKTADQLSPVPTDLSVIHTENKISVVERQDLKAIVEKHSVSLVEIRETLARINTMTMEQEGQHNAHDLLRNQMMVEEFRLLGLLWQKVYEQPLPESLYFGKVSQERVVK